MRESFVLLAGWPFTALRVSALIRDSELSFAAECMCKRSVLLPDVALFAVGLDVCELVYGLLVASVKRSSVNFWGKLCWALSHIVDSKSCRRSV